VPAYGWKWILQLAKYGADVVGPINWSRKAADHNADSYAIFGVAAKLLDDKWPRRVSEDGRIEPVV
jgi:hypothetical protein